MMRNLMKVIILLLLASGAYGQDSIPQPLPGHIIIDQHDFQTFVQEFEYNPETQYSYWPMVDGDTIRHVEAIDYITIYDPKKVLIEMLSGYVESIDSTYVHFLPDRHKMAISACSLTYPSCSLPDHHKMIKPEPNFADFINYILKQ